MLLIRVGQSNPGSSGASRLKLGIVLALSVVLLFCASQADASPRSAASGTAFKLGYERDIFAAQAKIGFEGRYYSGGGISVQKKHSKVSVFHLGDFMDVKHFGNDWYGYHVTLVPEVSGLDFLPTGAPGELLDALCFIARKFGSKRLDEALVCDSTKKIETLRLIYRLRYNGAKGTKPKCTLQLSFMPGKKRLTDSEKLIPCNRFGS
jgi:hypothetical protein